MSLDTLDGGYDAERLRAIVEKHRHTFYMASADARGLTPDACYRLNALPALLSALEAKDAEIVRLRDGKAMLAQHANAVAKAKDAALERAEALLREAREKMPHKGPHSLAARIDAALTARRAARGK